MGAACHACCCFLVGSGSHLVHAKPACRRPISLSSCALLQGPICICKFSPACGFHGDQHELTGFVCLSGQLNSNGNQLLVFGKQFGNVFIGVQPTFGYEGDPMRLLFSKSASPHHGFAAFYTYLEKIFKVSPRPTLS